MKIGDVLGTHRAAARPAPGGEACRRRPALATAQPRPLRRPLALRRRLHGDAAQRRRRWRAPSPTTTGSTPPRSRAAARRGRVMKDDVLTVLDGRSALRATAPPLLPRLGPAPGAREERVKMTPLRKRVAERLLAAQNNAAILTTFNEVDMGEVMALRKQYGERFEKKHGVKLGFMSFFVPRRDRGAQGVPRGERRASTAKTSSSSTTTTSAWRCPGSRGLVVPVLRDADTLSHGRAREADRRAAATKARNDKLHAGGPAGRHLHHHATAASSARCCRTPILNPPQTGILGMHNIVERPVVRDGQIVIRPVMYLALSATTTGSSTAARRCSSWCASRSASRTRSGCCSRSETRPSEVFDTSVGPDRASEVPSEVFDTSVETRRVKVVERRTVSGMLEPWFASAQNFSSSAPGTGDRAALPADASTAKRDAWLPVP